eukprot:CAMPEP_0177234488 /NCGR_PEP_ID=MMETSP0367-20130122/44422_1 /TAXON_ID=447022 ORGANISM="Scrippsiella hangoei-like, Strain SHHI-4" /NCGR_SAMPLE_ID=MMETSP0367 /ASSEMBLY_ACC=CAM_ASM_000362 /LENGTH=34 /DNA_ID= /DNA_START= /DNA_END= /DNA_ORIENTATION=
MGLGVPPEATQLDLQAWQLCASNAPSSLVRALRA